MRSLRSMVLFCLFCWQNFFYYYSIRYFDFLYLLGWVSDVDQMLSLFLKGILQQSLYFFKKNVLFLKKPVVFFSPLPGHISWNKLSFCCCLCVRFITSSELVTSSKWRNTGNIKKKHFFKNLKSRDFKCTQVYVKFNSYWLWINQRLEESSDPPPQPYTCLSQRPSHSPPSVCDSDWCSVSLHALPSVAPSNCTE